MSKDPFKTRLEIAKTKISQKDLYKDKKPPPSIGAAFKMSKEFFFEPRLKSNNIAKELITINKLALVNEISTNPNLISGPIL